MPLFQLTDDLFFPRPELATRDGLLAVGGDLSAERLLLAYAHGIFPWFGEGDPLLWWSPDPRLVLFPDVFHVSKSLRRLHHQRRYRLTMDTHFAEVISACATTPREGQHGTWITAEMESAYIQLHKQGYAHSVEVWEDEWLVGGVYGVSLGRCFFGESMFSRRPNSSKLALWALCEQVRRWGFTLIDCQIHTDHLASLGARDVARKRFLRLLAQAMEADTRRGPWHLDADLPESMD
jgi:leucyl/phenylalanyl-tRNA--protein transferase